MPTGAAHRLLAYLTNSELAAALEAAGSRTAGSKEIRLQRIITERIQPTAVLRSVGLVTLREICRQAGAPVTGNKDELIDRIINHFAQGKDQYVEEMPHPPHREERRLDEYSFKALFGFLLHHELTDILRRFPDLRQTGAKDVRIATLWEAHPSEETLLAELMSRDLEDILQRLRLRLTGSKKERIDRIIGHFALGSPQTDPEDFEPCTENKPVPAESPEALALQATFRQRAASPHSALQPWLEEILGGQGLIRCYATEDVNPTKQLKNKLAQAAAARGGLLVLTLVDEAAFQKASEALLDRWATNNEWAKSIACVALAYPLGSPVIRTIIEWTDSPWPTRIRERLFGSVEVLRARTDGLEPTSAGQSHEAQGECGHDIPAKAQFCPQCGRRLRRQ